MSLEAILEQPQIAHRESNPHGVVAHHLLLGVDIVSIEGHPKVRTWLLITDKAGRMLTILRVCRQGFQEALRHYLPCSIPSVNLVGMLFELLTCIHHLLDTQCCDDLGVIPLWASLLFDLNLRFGGVFEPAGPPVMHRLPSA